jgi:integrase
MYPQNRYPHMPLNYTDVKNAKPAEKPYKLADGHGLHLLVQPTGSKFWRYRYRFNGVEKMLALGTFPATSLADARERRDAARKQLEAGVDPSLQKKLDKIASATAARNTFGMVVAEFLEQHEAKGSAEATKVKVRWLLQDVAAPLASRPIAEITPIEVLELLRRIERSGRRETARRLRAMISAVFRLAIITQRAASDPTAALQGALVPPNVKQRAAITDEKQFGRLLLAIDEYDGWPTLKAALLFTALTFARPGEVRGARRTEIDFNKAIWKIPAERTKVRRPHEVPLSRQAIDVLKSIWSLSEYGELVFHSIRSIAKPLSENAMNAALRRMGYMQDEVSSHGFRSTASTILNERGFNPDVIEAALAHQHENTIRRTYNRARYWPERVEMMQRWADMLDEFRRL